MYYTTGVTYSDRVGQLSEKKPLFFEWSKRANDSFIFHFVKTETFFGPVTKKDLDLLTGSISSDLFLGEAINLYRIC